MAVEVPGRVLGLDLGDVRIGVAISDDARRLAVPLGTVQVGRPPGELRAIAALVAEHGVTLVVLGLPLSLDGSHGPRAIHAEAFAETLRMVLHVPVAMQGERFTTVEAERELRGSGRTGPARTSAAEAAAARTAPEARPDAGRSGAS